MENKKNTELIHWADQVADQIITEKGDKKQYVCASGITPSGTVHIGNFREIITTDLITKALEDRGKKVRFIYSWDDYDRFRKVPKNLPEQDRLKQFLGCPVSSVPDPYGCHKSYAEHFEKQLEESLKDLDLNIEFIRQNEKFKSCAYAENIRTALKSRARIKKILDKFRKEAHPEDWIPLEVYCEKCGTDFTEVTGYDEEYTIDYECKCGNKNKIDFRKVGIVKPPWRVDWPMRWDVENVDFEPGGKEHSSAGGSRDTAKIIVKHIYQTEPPIYKMYDYIILKGIGGKMSGSLGNVISVQDVLDVYLPEILRFLFAGTKPNKEFALAFDDELFKVYDDFYKTERAYFLEDEKNPKKLAHLKRVYRLSIPFVIPKKMPIQPAFRTVCDTLQATQDKDRTKEIMLEGFENPLPFDIIRVEKIIECADHWLQKYAAEQFKIKINDTISKEVISQLSDTQIKALKRVKQNLKSNTYSADDLFGMFKETVAEENLEMKDFFRGFYLALIGKERGPRLTGFIKAIGEKKVIEILESLK
ncbi:MAG: lysine--tRNA ligase [Candidatus Aenigmarchaeota archaeon]|nr:lysine--tRNA ligase [Candidatus Aenigmarchaeota archaeon]